jgi:hypothetical protein
VLALARPVVMIAYAAEYREIDWRNFRTQIASTLKGTPGDHLVLVCYTPDHNVDHEWVYNAADIDSARVVWARVIPQRDLTPLLEYFKNRSVWVVYADSLPPDLHPFSSSDRVLFEQHALGK